MLKNMSISVVPCPMCSHGGDVPSGMAESAWAGLLVCITSIIK